VSRHVADAHPVQLTRSLSSRWPRSSGWELGCDPQEGKHTKSERGPSHCDPPFSVRPSFTAS
jgi:hypothetical protein